jgi:CRISPR-associated protein Cmr5
MPNKLEQGRASFAYNKVQEFYNNPNNSEKEKKEYRSYVKKIPMLIKTNGLGATYAFAYSKNNKSYKALYNQTEEWLREDEKHLIPVNELGNNTDFVETLVKLDSSKYRAVTVEVLALFNWMRRFAEGMLEGGEQT